jgi:hypothetical protein
MRFVDNRGAPATLPGEPQRLAGGITGVTTPTAA